MEKSDTGMINRIRALLDAREGAREVAPFAREAGIPPGTVHSILNGTIPRADNAVKLAQALGTTVEYLITGEGRSKKHPAMMSLGEAMQHAIVSDGGGNYDAERSPAADLQAKFRHQERILEELGYLIGSHPSPAAIRALVALSISYNIKPTDLIPLFDAIAVPPGGDS